MRVLSAPQGFLAALGRARASTWRDKLSPFLTILKHACMHASICAIQGDNDLMVGAGNLKGENCRFLERNAEDGDIAGEDGSHPITQAVYLTWGTPVGAAGFGPKTLAGKIFSWSWSFWCLLVTAAYTATLASAFTVQAATSSLVSDIEDIQRSGLPVCIVKGSAIEDIMLKQYPKIASVPVDSEVELYTSMRAGKCTAAVTFHQYWHQYRSKRAVNGVEGTCRHVSPAGSTILSGEGGFVIKADSGGQRGKCTSLIRDVFDLHMNDMFLDGFIQDEMAYFFSQQADMKPHCPSAGPGTALDTDNQTDILGMAGTFLIHAAFSLLALLITLAQSFIKVLYAHPRCALRDV
eukprot:Tamp_06282.p1 GENE.Tamp_06282~~Tamp_06282.p1  ORF type:complete len:350 (+),score=38.02 Tamp_06282:746-1795(+)